MKASRLEDLHDLAVVAERRHEVAIGLKDVLEGLRELAVERAWEEAFTSLDELLRRLADEALEEHAAGQTQELDPDRL